MNKNIASVAKVTDNPKLKTKIMSDGNLSLYLDYYLGRVSVAGDDGDVVSKVKRKREFLKLYLYAKPKTPVQRQQNADTLRLAQKIRFEKEQQFKQVRLGYNIAQHAKMNFIDYIQTYYDNYTKKDKPIVKMCHVWFSDFLKNSPQYHDFKDYLLPTRIDGDLVKAFADYCTDRGKGECGRAVFARFKKVVLYATDHEIFTKNPCKGISVIAGTNSIKKEILSLDEIAKLVATMRKGGNPEIRRTFIFCLYTGIRYCDVKLLTFANVDYSNRILRFEQSKVKHSSKASGVTIPLNESLITLLGAMSEGGNRGDRIFNLPSYPTCLKELREWVADAGIKKHITWHCARHSFAVNILNGGANVKVVASLLGHSSLSMTEKYLRAVDSAKRKAIESLPALPTLEK